jgi:CBS domain-containing protein
MATLSLSYIALQAHQAATVSEHGGPQAEQADGSVVNAVDVLGKAVTTTRSGDELVVADIMTSKVVTTGPGSLLSDAYAAMMRAGVRRFPVVGEDGTLIGIVTLGDLREARPSKPSSPSIYELNYLIAAMQVRDVMTHNPYTVQADAPLATAARIISEHKVGALPVLNNTGQLVGIITESDIFRTLVEMWFTPETSTGVRK